MKDYQKEAWMDFLGLMLAGLIALFAVYCMLLG